MTIFDFLTMLGSLSLFLFGMSVMGTALEKRAGGSLKAILAKLTSGRFSGLLTGLAVTAVIQSSSATTVMVVGFVNSGLLSLRQSIPVIMGANIGTTVTALLACIGQGKDAARAALAHSCFNLSGSLLAAVLLPWFVRLVEFISPKGPELEVISRQIANAHTAFNVCCALLWLPFLPWMVRLVCALVPEKEKK